MKRGDKVKINESILKMIHSELIGDVFKIGQTVTILDPDYDTNRITIEKDGCPPWYWIFKDCVSPINQQLTFIFRE